VFFVFCPHGHLKQRSWRQGWAKVCVLVYYDCVCVCVCERERERGCVSFMSSPKFCAASCEGSAAVYVGLHACLCVFMISYFRMAMGVVAKRVVTKRVLAKRVWAKRVWAKRWWQRGVDKEGEAKEGGDKEGGGK